ncbi:MAG: DeoR/GlpR family DNA-binding transcription regulator [Actinomycetota bacterium]|nr:DeoR/GlpR family DNA-binding transcription regulator [Actinomycetota bacterium]
MYAEERHQAIAGLMRESGRISVSELAERFGVTAETARRDLAVLERAGLLRRVHGGAVATTALSMIETEVAERDSTRAEEKANIAKAAVALLPQAGGAVLLDAGTTTARLASLMPVDRELFVVTNSLGVAGRLGGHTGVELRLLGGRVRGVTQACVGDETVRALDDLRLDVAFLGTNAVSARHGMTTPDPDEAAVKRAMVRCARQVVVLADSSKLGQEQLVRFASVEEVDTLVTDAEAQPAELEALRRRGLEVVVA